MFSVAFVTLAHTENIEVRQVVKIKRQRVVRRELGPAFNSFAIISYIVKK